MCHKRRARALSRIKGAGGSSRTVTDVTYKQSVRITLIQINYVGYGTFYIVVDTCGVPAPGVRAGDGKLIQAQTAAAVTSTRDVHPCSGLQGGRNIANIHRIWVSSE